MAMTPEYFVGKTAVVTGAASGIGRATALAFARQGANVVLVDLDESGAEAVAKIIRDKGAGALVSTTDVSDRAAVDDMTKAAIARFGLIDFQINSAGAAGRWAKFLEIDAELWRKAFAINADGVFHCMQAVLPHMVANGGGVIVNMASMAHKRGGAGTMIHYAAAKGAVVSMTLGVAREFADRGIRALSISPGPIETAFQASAGSDDGFMRQSVADVPMGRFGKPEEIAELALFMCSDACGFMTADTVYVNGGGGWR